MCSRTSRRGRGHQKYEQYRRAAALFDSCWKGQQQAKLKMKISSVENYVSFFTELIFILSFVFLDITMSCISKDLAITVNNSHLL